jgi:hypothetical protein
MLEIPSGCSNMFDWSSTSAKDFLDRHSGTMNSSLNLRHSAR